MIKVQRCTLDAHTYDRHGKVQFSTFIFENVWPNAPCMHTRSMEATEVGEQVPLMGAGHQSNEQKRPQAHVRASSNIFVFSVDSVTQQWHCSYSNEI